MKSISTWFKKVSKEGMYVPYFHDGSTGKPSITLMFPYITFVIAVISTIALHFSLNLLVATITSITFWAVATVFYMIRKITKASFDLDDKEFSIENKGEPS